MASDYAGAVRRSSGGDKLTVYTGGEIEMQSGATLDLQAGTTITVAANVTLSSGADLAFSGTTGQSEITLTDNLADALSICEGANDYITFTTTNSSESVNVGQHLTIADAKNVVLNTTTGTKIGTATTQKLGFFDATPVVQPGAYTQTYSTADKTHANATASTLTLADGAGTNDNTIGAITGDASVIAAFQEVVDEVNKLIADVADVKQLVNSVIDDLQALGLVG